VRLEAAVFDMDGVLVDSEPLWQDAEIEVFAGVGVALTNELCRQTMGLRIDEAVDHWHRRFGWTWPAPAVVAAEVVRRVSELIAERGEPLPGVDAAVAACRHAGLRLALASSSPRPLIEAVLAKLGLAGTFEVVHSADDEPFGKPHPGIYLTTAARLGVAPTACLAIEDSVNGVIAAKAARMACVAVPLDLDDPRFGIADLVLPSLADLDLGAFAAA
jgi:HAD superfamily hydrolase (TIGR01509 family)